MLDGPWLKHPAFRAFWMVGVLVLVMLLRGVTDKAGMPGRADWLRAAPFLLAFAAIAASYGHQASYLARAALFSVGGILGVIFESVVLRRAGVPPLTFWVWAAPITVIGGFLSAAWRPGSTFRGIWNM